MPSGKESVEMGFLGMTSPSDALVRLMGWKGAIIQGTPSMYDRYVWLRRNLVPGSVKTFDAGSGSGAYSFYASSLGNEVVGLSFDARNNAVARHRADILGLKDITFIDGDLTELDQTVGTLAPFDQIICMEVIEHMKDDQGFLQSLAGLLQSGGRIMLSTPYQHHRPTYGETVDDEVGSHVRWGYTFEELRTMFEASGLRILSEDYLCGMLSQKIGFWQRSLSLRHPLTGWVITLPLRVLLPIDPLITRLLKYPHLTVAVVAMKWTDNDTAPTVT